MFITSVSLEEEGKEGRVRRDGREKSGVKGGGEGRREGGEGKEG